jgi:hypothetical protein
MSSKKKTPAPTAATAPTLSPPVATIESNVEEEDSMSEVVQIELEPLQFQNLIDSVIFLKTMMIQMNDRIQKMQSDIDAMKTKLIKDELSVMSISDFTFSDMEVDNALKIHSISGDVELLKKFHHPQFMRVKDRKIEFMSQSGWISEDDSPIKMANLIKKITSLYIAKNKDIHDDEMNVKQEHITRIFMDNNYKKQLTREFIAQFAH